MRSLSTITTKSCFRFYSELAPISLAETDDDIVVLIRILARGLELPEDTFLKMHGFDDDSETYGEYFRNITLGSLDDAPPTVRFMK